jgi:hypothetical protein
LCDSATVQRVPAAIKKAAPLRRIHTPTAALRETPKRTRTRS